MIHDQFEEEGGKYQSIKEIERRREIKTQPKKLYKPHERASLKDQRKKEKDQRERERE